MSLAHSSLGEGEPCQRSYLILQWGHPAATATATTLATLHGGGGMTGVIASFHFFRSRQVLAVTGCRIQVFSDPSVVSLECLVPLQTSPVGEELHFGSIKHSCFLGGSCHPGPIRTRCSAVPGVQVLPTQLTFPAGRRLLYSVHMQPHKEAIKAPTLCQLGKMAPRKEGEEAEYFPPPSMSWSPSELGPCSTWKISFPPSCCLERKRGQNPNLTHGQTSPVVWSL
ncbi:UNVERIFIED_CONTAM: hypothetical protein K2H54_008554 [Gekko kuhli]